MTKKQVKPKARTKPKSAKPTPPPRAKPAMFITAKMLREHDACTSAIRKFKRIWPNGARAILANCERAGEKGFCFWWMRDNLLSAKGKRRFDKIVRGARYSDDVTSQCPYCPYEGLPAPRAFAEAARL